MEAGSSLENYEKMGIAYPRYVHKGDLFVGPEPHYFYATLTDISSLAKGIFEIADKGEASPTLVKLINSNDKRELVLGEYKYCAPKDFNIRRYGLCKPPNPHQNPRVSHCRI